MKIYLGDLGHYTIKLTNNFTPINIGFLAAYLDAKFGSNVDIRLFKDPRKLADAVRNNPPDMLALSNYVWCQAVSEDMFRYYRSLKNDGVTVFGGPNFPMNELHKAKQYMNDHSFIDFYIPYEGETPIVNIAQGWLNYGDKIRGVRQQHPEQFEGAFFVNDDGELIGEKIGIQIPDINVIPSPYLGGWLDEFLEEGLHPMFETQRGCPYSCAFCHTGLSYYNRGRTFSLDRCIEETKYITERVPDPNSSQLYITDSNWGMWPQDLEYTVWLRDHTEKTGFPMVMATTTGKGRGKHVLKTVLSHPRLMLSNSVQSLDDNVLKTIKRKNLSLEYMQDSQKILSKNNKISEPEVILGLPNETRESHLNSLRKLIHEIGGDIISQYTLMLLAGTEIYTDKMRQEYQYMIKYRMLPTSFGEYTDEKCFEIEEVSVATKDLSFADYLDMREMFFFVHNVHSNLIYQPLVRFLVYLNDDVIDFFLLLMRIRLTKGNHPANRIIQDYIRDTQEELFDSREEIVNYYSKDENYQKLLSGEEGKNLTHTYRAICLLHARDWAEFVLESFYNYIIEKYPHNETYQEVASDIVKHIKAQSECQYLYFRDRQNIPTKENPLNLELEYDIKSIFSAQINQKDYPVFKKKHQLYHYHMSDDAVNYVRKLPENLRVVDWQLIVLRLDRRYIFPICIKEESALVS